jgi:hypothetical protein
MQMEIISERFGQGSLSFESLDGVLHAFVGWKEDI